MSISFQQHHQVTVNINPLINTLTSEFAAAQTNNNNLKQTKINNKTNNVIKSKRDQGYSKQSQVQKGQQSKEMEYFAKSGKSINKENKQSIHNPINSSLKAEEQQNAQIQIQAQATLPKGLNYLVQNQPRFQDIPQNDDNNQQVKTKNKGISMLNQNQFFARKMNPISTLLFDSQPSTQQTIKQNSYNINADSSVVKGNQKQAFNYNQQSSYLNHQAFQPETSQNTSHVLHQASMSHSFSMRDPIYDGSTPDRIRGAIRSETLDSNGNVIRGRRVDSPQLVVVRELRDQEDLEEGTGASLIGKTGGGGIIDKDLLMKVFYSGDEEGRGGLRENGYQQYKNKRDRTNSDQRRKKGKQQQFIQRQPKAKSKSQDNYNAKKKIKSTQNNNKINSQHQIQQMQLMQGANHNGNISSGTHDKQIINIEELQSEQRKNKLQQIGNSKEGATKSSRELRTSMGFQELLNQLDKDVSLQQSNQFDLKNKTSHDLLKLELSGIRRQNSSGANLVLQNNFINNKSSDKNNPQKRKSKVNEQPFVLRKEGGTRSRSNERNTRSKSKEKPAHNKIVTQNTVIPKSILKRVKKGEEDLYQQQQQQIEKVFQYPLLEVTPDRNQNHQGVSSTSFLHSEHGRQMPLTNISMKAHEGGLPPSNINVLFSKIKVGNKLGTNSNQGQSNYNIANHQINGQSSGSQKQRDHSSGSPDRQGVQEYKPSTQTIGSNIDKIVRENLKKIRSKEDEEKLQKFQIEDQLRKKKEFNEMKNNMVRKINKEKTYKKNQINQHTQNNQIQNTINNNQNLITNQQSSQEILSTDKIQQLNKQFWDEKNKQINQNILMRQAFIHKSSQTQKIEFDRIKQSSKSKNLKIKNHRKSYGLEFIDIKREIQDELRTIEAKYKNNLMQSKQNLADEDSQQNIIADLEFPDQPKRLKIKTQKKIQTSQNQKDDQISTLVIKHHGTDQFISERVKSSNNYNQPNQQINQLQQSSNKVIIVKKNKIRKFMKQKKKLIFNQKFNQQKEEMIKAIKMKENISKLNEFCKKKLEKQLQKKRNATIPVNDEQNEGEFNRRDLSRISGRRIFFDNFELKKTLNPQTDDKLNDTLNDDNDSSRLSNEFYEEYYRLINSIKKEQQIIKIKNSNHSRMDISSQNITQKSIKNLLSSPRNHSQSPNTQLSQTQQHIFSPKQLQQSRDKQFKKKSKSKSNLKHNEGVQLVNQNLIMQRSQGNLIINKVKNQLKSTENQFQNLKERAESAPLLMNQVNGSNRKKSQQLRKKSPQGLKSQQKHKSMRIKQQKSKNSLALRLNQLSDEERFRFILNKVLKIQNFYRSHLFAAGFYFKGDIIDSQIQIQEDFQSGQNTVVHNNDRIDQLVSLSNTNSNEYQTQQLDLSQDKSLKNKTRKTPNIQSEVRKEMQQDKFYQEDVENEDDSDEHYDDYYDERQGRNGSSQMIIINQQNNDDKKVVYMSNINSCSLPQTPKIDESVPLQSNLQMNQLQKVFEYRPDINQQMHLSISQKPSIESQNSEGMPRILDMKKADTVKILKDILNSGKSSSDDQDLEEQKIADGDRKAPLLGQDSLLKDFKQNTPRQQIVIQISNQPTMRQIVSQQTSVQSQYQKQSNQLNPDSKIHSHTNTNNNGEINSHSSQSLFERNSFQQFTQSKIQQMMKNNEFMNLIEIREKALQYRKTKEKKFIKKMYKDRNYSPRTYTSKREQLERWVQLEQEEIKKTKNQFEEEWEKTLKMIEETQKDVDTMRQKMKIHIDNSSQKHNHNHHLHFNSHSSRNSSSSYNTISKQEPRKSILELEEFQPISQRSVRLSLSSSRVYPKSGVDKYQIIKDQKQLQQDMSLVKTYKEQQIKHDDGITYQNIIEPPNEENLIDYLEQSWIKNQQNQLKDQQFNSGNTSSNQQNNNLNQRPGLLFNEAHGIFIEDQEDKQVYSSGSKLSDVPKQMLFDYIQDSDEIVSQNLITERRDATISNIVQQFHQQNTNNSHDDERPLTRSRSEQDLSDLLKKSKINFNELDLNIIEGAKLKEIDSYRFEQRPLQEDLMNNKKQTHNAEKHKNNNHDEIRIQENLFEDSSNRYSKGKNYYQDMNELQSNDSLLNESELNNYFQDQKFSIEDFKSLDKRKLAQNLNQNDDKDESESLLGRVESQIEINHDKDELQRRQEHQINQNTHNQLFQPPLEFQVQTGFDKIDPEPSFIDQRRQDIYQNRDDDPRDSSQDNIYPTAFMHHQQALLFAGSKPGENIKISDILRKNQSLQDPNISNSFQFGGDTSQLLFQNVQINQSMTNPSLQPLINPDYQLLAEQITEELLQQMLKTLTVVEKRKPDESTQSTIQSSHLGMDSQADVFIIDSQINEKENRREMAEYRMRIVVEQDLIRVENYINEVIQALQQAELQYLTLLAHNPQLVSTQDSNYHRQFLAVLTTPIKRNELDLLNQLQTSEIGSYEHFETTLDLNSNQILPIDLYLDIERQREESQIRMLYQNGVHDVDLESSVMQESTHIHNKSVFDALNESLMKFRPYGIQGEPMPWSNKNRRLQTKVDTNSVDTERLFFMVKQDVLRWAQTFAGCSPSPIFLFRRQIQDDSEQFDDELFQETRERRLASMLATEVVENEHQWLNYEFEEAQVKIDLSDMILEHLVEEVVLFMNKQNGIDLQPSDNSLQ